jgi:hypothetical protein
MISRKNSVGKSMRSRFDKVGKCEKHQAHYQLHSTDVPDRRSIRSQATMSNTSNGNIIQLEEGWNNVIKKGVSAATTARPLAAVSYDHYFSWTHF